MIDAEDAFVVLDRDVVQVVLVVDAPVLALQQEVVRALLVADEPVVVLAEDVERVILDRVETRVLSHGQQGAPGPQGPPGLPGGQISYQFDWGDATPKPLLITAGLVVAASIIVEEAFDGAGAALAIGDAGDPARLQASSQNDPAILDRYEANPGYRYASPTALLLTITPGAGATQGGGTVYLEIVP